MKRFLKQLLPWPGDSFGRVLLKLIFLGLIAVVIACGVQLALYARGYFSELNAEQKPDSLWPGSMVSQASSGPNRSFDKLLKQNPDVRAWLKIPDTQINYVVAQGKDNAFYLHRSLDKKYNSHGTIFLDYRDKIKPMSQNLIIYGHHMRDGSMFHDLIKYKKLGFYNKSPLVDLDTLYASTKWKIFAVMIVNTRPKQGKVFEYLYSDFGSTQQFTDFITGVRRRSLFNTGVDVKPDDKILTLSTCTYEVPEARLVVMARLVRPDESLTVPKAVKNPHPLYPDAWYKTYGGKKPTFTSSASSTNTNLP